MASPKRYSIGGEENPPTSKWKEIIFGYNGYEEKTTSKEKINQRQSKPRKYRSRNGRKRRKIIEKKKKSNQSENVPEIEIEMKRVSIIDNQKGVKQSISSIITATKENEMKAPLHTSKSVTLAKYRKSASIISIEEKRPESKSATAKISKRA